MCTPTDSRWGCREGERREKGSWEPLLPRPLMLGLGNEPVSQAFGPELRMPWVPPKNCHIPATPPLPAANSWWSVLGCHSLRSSVS